MTSVNFAFWLQGFFEIANPKEINETETKLIKAHLNLVFKHEIDPSMGDQKHQDELNAIHSNQVENPIQPFYDAPHLKPMSDENGAVLRC